MKSTKMEIKSGKKMQELINYFWCNQMITLMISTRLKNGDKLTENRDERGRWGSEIKKMEMREVRLGEGWMILFVAGWCECANIYTKPITGLLKLKQFWIDENIGKNLPSRSKVSSSGKNMPRKIKSETGYGVSNDNNVKSR